MKVCINDYPNVEEASAARSRLPQPIHGTTQVSPKEASNAHPMDEVSGGQWCLMVDEQLASEAKKILGIEE